MFEYSIPQELPAKRDRFQPISGTPASNYIFDIRLDNGEDQLRESLRKSIRAACHHEAAMPDLLLWDEKGLRYFEEVTYSPTYYLTNEEIGILEKQKYNIAQYIQPGSMLIELGSGYANSLPDSYQE